MKIEFSDGLGGTFAFPVDADDFVNRKIAEWVETHSGANGFKSKDGYQYIYGKKYVTITPWYGGSMNIMKLYADDFPDDLPDGKECFLPEVAKKLTERYPICWYDIEVKGRFEALGKPFQELPFKSTVYVLGTGDNLSEDDPGNNSRRDRFHPIAFLRRINPLDKRMLTTRLKNEFGMP